MQRVVTLLLLVAMPRLVFAQVSYSSDLKQYYSRIVTHAPAFPPATPVEPALTVPSPMRSGTATLESTDATTVPYDHEEAHIRITRAGATPVYVAVSYFRTMTLSWVTERTLLIERDVGPTAGIEEILDVIDRRWLSQQSVSYPKE